MLSEGTAAPLFELPALVDGERQRVTLSEYLGEDVVILAFYPADFNPACDETSCDLDELDLFTMQKDVTILGISPDSVYSHRAFAERYDLKVPLLADTDHAVAEQYDLDFVDALGQRLTERAVVVIDHDGEVQYAWSTDDLEELPRVEAIKDAIADTGGDDTAFARYRIGHAHYTEGRRTFTAAMKGFRNSEWMVAQGDFQQAREEFENAEDHFDTALRFVDDERLEPIYEGAKTKANSLWQASDWLAQAASAYSSGSGAKGQELRDDAERPLGTAKGFTEPPDPDGEWPPALESLDKDPDEDRASFLPQEEDNADTSLDVDIDDEVEQADADGDGADDEEYASSSPLETTPPDDETETATATESDAATVENPDGAADAAADESTTADGPGEIAEVDDAEIEEIQAELAASQAETESTDPLETEPTAMVEAPPETVLEEAADGTSEEMDAADGESEAAQRDAADGDDDGDAGRTARVDGAVDSEPAQTADQSESASVVNDDEAVAEDGAAEAGDGAARDATGTATGVDNGSERDGPAQSDATPNAAGSDGTEPPARHDSTPATDAAGDETRAETSATTDETGGTESATGDGPTDDEDSAGDADDHAADEDDPVELELTDPTADDDGQSGSENADTQPGPGTDGAHLPHGPDAPRSVPDSADAGPAAESETGSDASDDGEPPVGSHGGDTEAAPEAPVEADADGEAREPAAEDENREPASEGNTDDAGEADKGDGDEREPET